MNILTRNEVFDSYVEAEKYASSLLTFEQIVETYRDMSIAEKQQFVVYKVQILGSYATMLFIRYEVVKTEDQTEDQTERN